MLGQLLPTKLLKALWPRVEGEGETLLSALPTSSLRAFDQGRSKRKRVAYGNRQGGRTYKEMVNATLHSAECDLPPFGGVLVVRLAKTLRGTS